MTHDDSEVMTYEDMRLLVVLVRLNGEQDAQTCAAMISMIDKAESAGQPVPGYVGLLERVRKEQLDATP